MQDLLSAKLRLLKVGMRNSLWWIWVSVWAAAADGEETWNLRSQRTMTTDKILHKYVRQLLFWSDIDLHILCPSLTSSKSNWNVWLTWVNLASDDELASRQLHLHNVKLAEQHET